MQICRPEQIEMEIWLVERVGDLFPLNGMVKQDLIYMFYQAEMQIHTHKRFVSDGYAPENVKEIRANWIHNQIVVGK